MRQTNSTAGWDTGPDGAQDAGFVWIHRDNRSVRGSLRADNAADAASGVFTDQDPYILPVGTRRISFFISYQRGFSGGHASFRLFWNNGIEEVQETLIDSVYENVDSAHSNQSMYLQDTSGPTPADDNLIRFIMYVDVPPGIISVRLRASETGYVSLPGSCGITITPSLV